MTRPDYPRRGRHSSEESYRLTPDIVAERPAEPPQIAVAHNEEPKSRATPLSRVLADVPEILAFLQRRVLETGQSDLSKRLLVEYSEGLLKTLMTVRTILEFGNQAEC
jgi:hypothetical protein